MDPSVTDLRRQPDPQQMALLEYLRQGCDSAGDSMDYECGPTPTVCWTEIESVGQNGSAGAQVQFGQSETASLGVHRPPW